MSCCGNNRSRLAGPSFAPSPPAPGPAGAGAGPAPRPRAYFRNLSARGFALVGPATGRRYAFQAHGPAVEVDWADRPYLKPMAQLREEGKP